MTRARAVRRLTARRAGAREAGRQSTAAVLVRRSRIVPASAHGDAVVTVARRLHGSTQTVRTVPTPSTTAAKSR